MRLYQTMALLLALGGNGCGGGGAVGADAGGVEAGRPDGTPQDGARTVTFDFDSGTPSLQVFQNVPFDQTAGGLTASFSSPAGAAFSVQSDASAGLSLSKFSGQYLEANNLERNLLEIKLSQKVVGLSLTFATADFHHTEVPTSLEAKTFLDTTQGSPLGSATAHGSYASDTMPIGTLSVGATQPFNLVQIGTVVGTGATTAFLVDNVVVTPN